MSFRKHLEDYGPIALMGLGIGFATTVALRGIVGGGLGKRGKILSIAEDEIGNKEWLKYLEGVAAMPGEPIAWCGIFALWVLHQAGIGQHIKWLYDGKGFLYRLPMTTNPQPGDLAYIPKNQHHAIVESVEGDIIQTIDGNSYGRKVARNRRPRSDFLAFYSIQPLIDGEIL